MESRIEQRMQQLQEKGEKAFITYMTAGLPSMEGCKELIKAQEQAGTDVLELGIPFSDPVADGPVIQDASYKSIQLGTNLKKVFALMKEVRAEGVELPIIFMMYYNTALYFGLEDFVEECIKSGVDGLIIPDLPLEEQGELQQFLQKEGAPILIELVSPVSADRIPTILEGARGFVYCVSGMGVTGQSGNFHKQILNYLASVKKVSKIPVMMGFGIEEAKDVAPMKEVIDGAIVGSHFIKLLEANDYAPKAAAEYCSRFKKELNQL
ncbi:tryptophan synthase subunit alpha [Roseburia sp. MSJ-14]|uniref:tryptophan synthase subunit alpha n=1 Tax=Roseburia sp. MSJ-14 TaxID=2841514 RepID=UPI001C129330|nr:tryptophan synthase subunit alpha [Roseburia sp. MSJ-14]MBU5475020.1 tryptophan synthase subunit alpha [Roseburia sp. MSJ-14]